MAVRNASHGWIIFKTKLISPQEKELRNTTIPKNKKGDQLAAFFD